MTHIQKSLIAFTAISLVLTARDALAADIGITKPNPALPVFAQLPAVDGLNAKISGFGGWGAVERRDTFAIPGLNNNRQTGVFGVQGSVSIPLGQSFGFQIDGLAASRRNAFLGGAGAHLFWRDPSKGLFGLYGSAIRNNSFGGLTNYKAGIEAEAYFGRFTLSGVAGWEGGNSKTLLVGQTAAFNVFDTFGTNGRIFDKVDLSWYPTDNWKLSVGHRYVGGQHAAALGTEVLFGLGGGTAAAVFVEGRIGERDNRAIIGGLTLYFGQKDKTLIRRHREDDPANRLFDDLVSSGNRSGKRGRYLQNVGNGANPPPPPPPPCNPSAPPFCNNL
jgi:hypothetical protein